MANSVQAYFREALEASLRESKICVTESAQIYVVNLLKEFSRSEVAFAGTYYGEKIILAELLERAYMAKGMEAAQIYRHLGDSSLYLLGFFKESRTHRLVSDSYYIDMGAEGYLRASSLSRSYAAKGSATFLELSERFTDIVKLMQIIANYSKLA